MVMLTEKELIWERLAGERNIVDGPRDYQVTVLFDKAGQKIMYAAFAKLKKI